MSYTVSWFSAGVSSAVATKLAIDEIDEVVYIHVEDQHPDTLRFVGDCGEWFGKPITFLQSPGLSVRDVLSSNSYINGPHGSKCTVVLKKRVRFRWEEENKERVPFRYMWGMDAGEANRVEGIKKRMPEFEHLFPLVDRRIGKAEAHEILKASGIRRPTMYDLGYHNNNCVGCVKGGMGYWNRIRVDFPDVFADRAKLEREVGHSCLNGTFLDELDPSAGRHDPPIVDECGLFCGMMALGAANG